MSNIKPVGEVHIQWLEKAMTAKINGNELTVLPYGYLGQAVKEDRTNIKDSLVEGVREMDAGNELYSGEYASGRQHGYNQALQDMQDYITKELT